MWNFMPSKCVVLIIFFSSLFTLFSLSRVQFLSKDAFRLLKSERENHVCHYTSHISTHLDITLRNVDYKITQRKSLKLLQRFVHTSHRNKSILITDQTAHLNVFLLHSSRFLCSSLTLSAFSFRTKLCGIVRHR